MLLLGALGLSGIPEAGHQQDQWDEHDLSADPDEEERLPLLEGLGGRRRFLTSCLGLGEGGGDPRMCLERGQQRRVAGRDDLEVGDRRRVRRRGRRRLADRRSAA